MHPMPVKYACMSYLNTSMIKKAVSYNQLMGYTRKFVNRADDLKALGKFDEAENLLEHASKRIAQRNKAVVNLADSVAEHGFNSPLAGAARKNRFAKAVAKFNGQAFSNPQDAASWLKRHPFDAIDDLKPIPNKWVSEDALSLGKDKLPFTAIDRMAHYPNAGVFAPQLAQVGEFLKPQQVKPLLDHAEELARNNKGRFISL